MKIEIVSKNYQVSDKLKEIIKKKINRLDKYFDKSATAKVLCKKENNISKLELNIRSNGLYYRAEVTGDSMFDNIDLALPKVERQIVKYGDKIESKLKRGALKEKKFEFFDLPFDEPERSVVKKKSYELEPISIEDAQMFLENIDNSFYVFLNRDTNRVNVIYKRLDGNYGLIETIY